MSSDARTIIREIENYVSEAGGNYSDWYAGVTGNYEERLQQHNVTGNCIVKETPSHEIARAIEAHFHDEGMQGHGGEGMRPQFLFTRTEFHQLQTRTFDCRNL